MKQVTGLRWMSFCQRRARKFICIAHAAGKYKFLCTQVTICLLTTLLFLAGCSSTPTSTEGINTLSDIAGAAVVIKHSMAQNRDINIEDRYRFIAFSISEQMQVLGFNDDQIKQFAQEIVDGGPYSSMEAEIIAVNEHYKSITDPKDY